MATEMDAEDEVLAYSLWEDFFSGLVYLLEVCEYNSSNVNLEFPLNENIFYQMKIYFIEWKYSFIEFCYISATIDCRTAVPFHSQSNGVSEIKV